jgi:hypothetical protein
MARCTRYNHRDLFLCHMKNLPPTILFQQVPIDITYCDKVENGRLNTTGNQHHEQRQNWR